MQWIRQGNVWMMLALPCVTVEAFGSSGGAIWRACINGRPVGSIAGAPSSRDVMRRTEEYFERRVEL